MVRESLVFNERLLVYNVRISPGGCVKESYDALETIIPLFDASARFRDVEDLLCANSHLPGPRGNLTLAFEFADYFEKESINKAVLGLLVKWVDISADEAPPNDPREYLTFCGTLALGSHYCYANETTKSLIMDRLKSAMSDT